MDPQGDWNNNFRQLLSLPKAFAQAHREEINALFEKAGMATSWSRDTGAGANLKPALDHPGSDAGGLDMAPAHALAFLVIALNHQDHSSATPDAQSARNRATQAMGQPGQVPPRIGFWRRIRRTHAASFWRFWTLGEIWESAEEDP